MCKCEIQNITIVDIWYSMILLKTNYKNGKKHLSKLFYLKIYVAWPLCMPILSLYYSDLDKQLQI